MYLTAYQLVHRADSVQRYCLYTILQNYSQIFTFSGFPGGMVPLDPVPLRSIPPNPRLGPSRSCGHGRPHLSRGIMPSGHIILWLRRPFAPLGLHRRWSLANYFQNAELTTSTPPFATDWKSRSWKTLRGSSGKIFLLLPRLDFSTVATC